MGVKIRISEVKWFAEDQSCYLVPQTGLTPDVMPFPLYQVTITAKEHLLPHFYNALPGSMGSIF